MLNGGLNWGTSAELMNHYLLKYAYYDPDVLVVHTALNDAQAMGLESYHPDYSHWRRQMSPHLRMSPWVSWVTHSKLVGLALVATFYGLKPNVSPFVKFEQPGTEVDWFAEARIDHAHPRSIPKARIAYLNNLRSIIQAATHRGTRVILMPNHLRPDIRNSPELSLKEKQTTLNDAALTSLLGEYQRELAEETGVEFIEFPAEQLPLELWVDNMHVNETGCRIKADYVAREIRRLYSGATEGSGPAGRDQGA